MKKLLITITAIIVALTGVNTVAQARSSYHDHVIVAPHHHSTEARVQSRLKSLGYYHGRINGRLTSETSRAIRHYQARHHLRVTGDISRQLLRSLGLR